MSSIKVNSVLQHRFMSLFHYFYKALLHNDMTTIIIEENSPQAKQLIEYIKTLPFATVLETKKKSFREAAEECNAISVDVLFDELNERISKRFNNA